ncbi:MAG: carbon-nitrogen hydrolase family protein [bacterium]
MYKIAVAQFCSNDSIPDNLDLASELIGQASAEGAEAVFLPECFGLMQTSRQQLYDSAEQAGKGPIQEVISYAAKQHEITVFAGTLPIRSEDPKRVFNSSIVYGTCGEELARYDKIHLFDVQLGNGEQYFESDYTMPGAETVIVECSLGKVGLSVCYDLRFPELYRILVNKGAQILVVPSAFSSTTGPAHWHTLLRARAIENFCYVVASAQEGTHPSGRKTYGHTLVVDPWGRVIAEKQSGTGLLMAEIDLKRVEQARKEIPSLEHRKPIS